MPLRPDLDRLDQNLQLCLDAIAYAKGQAPRSANQTYYKATSPKKRKRRAKFLLAMTRRSEYGSYYTDDTHTTTEMLVNPERKKRRDKIEQLLRSGRSKEEIRRKLDEYIDKWGVDYFWGGERISSVKDFFVDQTGGVVGKDHWWFQKMMDIGGFSKDDLRAMDDNQWRYAEAITDMRQSAANAAQSGVGNCDEKAQLAASWILDHAYGDGRNLAMCYLDPAHGGVFGRVHYDEDGNPSGGGDHVFAIYDCNATPGVDYDTYVGKVKNMGPNAIIVDGWMNDAYPAQHHSLSLRGKNYRRNYNGEIINIKQSVVRDMVCISYRNHIKYRWNFNLPEGPSHDDAPPDRDALSRGTDQYKALGR